MDQSLSYAPLRVGDMVLAEHEAYFVTQAQWPLALTVEMTSWFRERMRMRAVTNSLTLDSSFGGRFDAFRQPQLELAAQRR
jgi:hypothetical protein